MQRERGPSIPYRYLVECPGWDKWLAERGVSPEKYYPSRIRSKRRVKANTESRVGQIRAYTVLGRPVEVILGKVSRWDWDSKYITKNCNTCSLCIPQEDAEAIAQILSQANGRAQITIPQELQGICLFGLEAESGSVRKFLVVHDSKLLMACNSDPVVIEQRASARGLKKNDIL